MRILILGAELRNSEIACYLRNLGHTVSFESRKHARDHSLAESFDYIISSGYAHIIGRNLIEQFKGRLINIHNSYLPFGRGIGAVLFSVLEGAPLGITIHQVDADFDTGPILIRREVPFREDETLRTYYTRQLAEEQKLLIESWDDICSGKVKAVDQAEFKANAVYRNRLDSELLMSLLPKRWNTPLSEVQRLGAEFGLAEQLWSFIETHSKSTR